MTDVFVFFFYYESANCAISKLWLFVNRWFHGNDQTDTCVQSA